MRRPRPRQLQPSPARRSHAPLRAVPAPAPADAAAPTRASDPLGGTAPALESERRLRASGGPEDSATYACRCGAVFGARPTTSVDCPLCGIHQAW